jgi:hypothetical protein
MPLLGRSKKSPVGEFQGSRAIWVVDELPRNATGKVAKGDPAVRRFLPPGLVMGRTVLRFTRRSP